METTSISHLSVFVQCVVSRPLLGETSDLSLGEKGHHGFMVMLKLSSLHHPARMWPAQHSMAVSLKTERRASRSYRTSRASLHTGRIASFHGFCAIYWIRLGGTKKSRDRGNNTEDLPVMESREMGPKIMGQR